MATTTRSRPIRCCGSAAKRHWRPLTHRRLACRAAEHLDGGRPGDVARARSDMSFDSDSCGLAGGLYAVDADYRWFVGQVCAVGNAADIGIRCRALVCDLAAGPLPAHPRGTRRKYIPVGAYAASMPRKVPRRWAGKDQSRWSVRRVASRACSVLLGSHRFRSASRFNSSNKQLFTRLPIHSLVRWPRRLRDRVAAWMPPPSPQGWVHGVSRER
ncbi:Hypothetical Protein LMG19146_02648 [Xanthomonas arboricola pv. fragariae]|nr:Hypothetical Protein LMG19146_02648 [Xanthomonas arboricola pv. fragariae]